MINMSSKDMRLRTGTTTVGVVCKDGVVLAADRKVTAGHLVAHKIGRKILPIDTHALITIAGLVADAQALVDVLRANASLYRIRNKRPIPINAIASLASNILFGSRFLPYIVEVNVGGYDLHGPSLYSIDFFGSVTNERNYVARGSGSPVALGVLEKEYREGIAIDEGVRIATLAVHSASRWDLYTGGSGIDVAVIDANGYRFLDDHEIIRILSS
ncbi:MAG: archaeal proteasome endopeptidase complex subunit beta [Thermoprotei archaeon]